MDIGLVSGYQRVGDGVGFWEPFKSILPTARTQLRESSPGALVGPAH